LVRTCLLRVNGADRSVHVDDRTPLLYVLRNDLGLQGAKQGCDHAAQCGACTVLLDGVEVPSCTLPVADADGHEITTSEGLGSRDRPSVVQRAFFDEQASQCGYCIPGMVVGATALLRANPSPAEAEIVAAINRHICRCGAHPRVLKAIARAAMMRPGAPISPLPQPQSRRSDLDKRSVEDRLSNGRLLTATSSDSWVTVDRDGMVTAYSGKVDMGTGLRTALAQIVADELDVSVEKVRVVLGDTGMTPDQGKSTASAGVMLGGQPLRVAACEARAALLERASRRLHVPAAALEVVDGTVFVKDAPERCCRYGELIGNEPLAVQLEVAEETIWGPQLRGKSALKPRDQYQYVGQPVARDVVAEHIAGSFAFIHDVSIPGMVHGRVVRPPTFGATLLAVDEGSVNHLPDVQVVSRANFVGVVAVREEVAVEAAKLLKTEWSKSELLYDEPTQFDEIRNAPVVAEQVNFSVGDPAALIGASERSLKADFHFACQLHAMLGPSCAVADVRPDAATIWSGTQWPNGDRGDIAAMLGLPAERVRLVWCEAAGSYGRLGCDDAAADAALVSQIVGRPVRVQWSRRDENGWEPVSAPTTISVEAAVDANGRLTAFDYRQWSSTHASAERGSHVAWTLLETAPGYDRLTGNIYNLVYEIDHKRGRSTFVEPTFRTIYLRGPGSVQSHFATESFIDELAHFARIDPIEFRLRHLPGRDREVIRAAADLAGWKPRAVPRSDPPSGGLLRGRGFAYAKYGVTDTLVAMVADVAVDAETWHVQVERVFVAHDCGFVVNPDGVLNQVQGNVVQGVSRSLIEEVHYSRARITSLDWNGYPVVRFQQVPRIEIELIQRHDMAPSVVGEVSSIPCPAAIANAIFDATGKRLRTVPFTPARLRNARSVYETVSTATAASACGSFGPAHADAEISAQ